MVPSIWVVDVEQARENAAPVLMLTHRATRRRDRARSRALPPCRDGSVIHLYKEGADSVRDRDAALRAVREHKRRGRILTGLLYVNPDSQELHHMLGTIKTALRDLGEADLCPGSQALTNINNSFR